MMRDSVILYGVVAANFPHDASDIEAIWKAIPKMLKTARSSKSFCEPNTRDLPVNST